MNFRVFTIKVPEQHLSINVLRAKFSCLSSESGEAIFFVVGGGGGGGGGAVRKHSGRHIAFELAR